jgi:outer membrane cobalamin receptor
MPIQKIILLFICCAVLTRSVAQKGTIAGYIVDEQSHSPLTGVSVMILNNNIQGDNSNQFGTFKINDVDPGLYEIIFTHIGYASEKIRVTVENHGTAVVRATLKKSNLTLPDVTVSAQKKAALNVIAALDIKLRPINTSQDILRIVPGLFIAQHAGGGKAEQIFLRGYDVDHGTDINITVDGLPVNMVSHAHGQGYSDLHFLIPETVEKLNFEKGPYFANKGNLATAGFVELQTKDFLENNLLKIQAGNFNTQRLSGMFRVLNKQSDKVRQQLYVASEYFKSEGYFENPQDFHRYNLMGKYNAIFNNNAQLTVLASTFKSRWNASGQVPERAVEGGIIGRFGSIDNSEGGNTDRSNFSTKFTKYCINGWQSTNQLYFTNYHFNLYSDFTFFLKDSVNADEINQREARNIYGYTGTVSKNYRVAKRSAGTTFGWGSRYDVIKNIALNHVMRRKFLNAVQRGDIAELNSFFYVNQHIEVNNRFNINGGLRYDYFRFAYKNRLTGDDHFSSRERGIFSPKLNFNYVVDPSIILYLNTGVGFHSNDTRVILNDKAKAILPRVVGTDLGFIIKPIKQLLIKAAAWQLVSQQEFVYAGDDGIVEPAGQSRRQGLDLSIRYQVNKWLYADMDLNLAKPRLVDAPKGANYIPLAPGITSIGGLSVKKKSLNGSIRYRYMGTRPANETNTSRAEGYFLLDAVLSYTFRHFEFSLSAENLLNTDWKEAQFYTESKLKYETFPTSDINFTPGTPRSVKTGISYLF